MEEFTWLSILSLFSKDKKCTIKTLDTLFSLNNIDKDNQITSTTDFNTTIRWYYTNKSGGLSKKKADSCTIDNIVERFARFALSNPYNTEQFIGMIVYSDTGIKQAMKRNELQSYLEENFNNISTNNTFLQVYLRPYRGEDYVITCKTIYSHETQAYMNEITINHQNDLPISDSIKFQMESITSSITDSLNATITKNKQVVQNLVFECILDDNQHCWLSRVCNCKLSPMILNPIEYNHHTSTSTTYNNNEIATSILPNNNIDNESNKNIIQQQPQEKSPSTIHDKYNNDNNNNDDSNTMIFNQELINPKNNDTKHHQVTHTIINTASTTTANNKNPYIQNTIHTNVVVNPKNLKSKNKKHQDVGIKKTLSKHQQLQLEEQPPSIDLIAQFAAARERQQLLQATTNNPSNIQDRDATSSYVTMKGESRSNNNTKQSQQHNSNKQMIKSMKGQQVLLPALDPQQIAISYQTNNSFAEKRLEELQKIASSAASIKSFVHQHNNTHRTAPLGTTNSSSSNNNNNNNVLVPRSTNYISGTEAEFLVRQVNSNDQLSQASVLSNLEEYDVLNVHQNILYDENHHYQGNRDNITNTTIGCGGLSAEESLWSVLSDNDGMMSMVGSNRNLPYQQQQQQSNIEDHGGGLIDLSEYASRVSKIGGSNSNNTAKVDKISDVFNDKIKTLEDQIVILNKNIERKEAELSKKDDKLRKLVLEVENTRQETLKDLTKQQNKYELEIHRLREQHAKEKAAIAIGGTAATFVVNTTAIAETTTTIPNSSPDKTKNSLSQIRSSNSANALTRSSNTIAQPQQQTMIPVITPSGGIESNIKLIEQLEILRSEQRRLQESFSEERRTMQMDGTNKLVSLEKKLKTEMTEMRKIQASLEDQIAQKIEECNTAYGRIQSLQNINTQLEVSKQNAIETQQRLRSDLKNMQQSVQASYRLESSQGLTADGGLDPQTSIRLNEAKNEAKLRQMNNKLEFLKAQLETEKKSADDARQASILLQAKIDEIREDTKLKLQHAASDQQKAVKDAEHLLDVQYQDRMKELTSLQMKVMSIQGALNDAQEQELLAKQREDAARALAGKSAAYQSALKSEVEQLRETVSQLRDEKETEILRETGKQNQDAVIRRLDNERQYLKSQLASELTHKNELQSALNRCQQQLSEVQKQWNSDVEVLKDSNITSQQQYTEKEQQLIQIQTQLESELQRIQNQNQDLKDGFIKMRDQVRMEQLTIENTNTIQRRLQEAYEESKAEVNRLTQQAIHNANMHKAELDAINDSIKEQELANQNALKNLREELSNQCMDNFDAHQKIMRLKDEFNEEKRGLIRISGAGNLIEILRKWRLSRLFVRFRQWQTNSSLVGAAKQFREQVEALLKKTSKDFHKEKINALNALKEELDIEHNNLLNKKQLEFKQQLDDALEQANMEKLLALESAMKEHEAQLKQLEEDYSFDMENLRKEKDLELQEAIDHKDGIIRQLKQNFIVEFENAKKEAEKQLENALVVKEQEMLQVMYNRLNEQEADLMVKQTKILDNLAVEHDFNMNELRNNLKEEMNIREAKLSAQHMIHIDELNLQFKRTMDEMNTLKTQEMEELRSVLHAENEEQQCQLRASMHEATELRIRELRVTWQEEFDALSIKQQTQFDLLLITKMEEYGKTMEAEKLRAVKLEGSKWKQALKDANQSHELENMKSKAEVTNLKDKELRLELEQALRNFEMQRQLEIGEQNAATAELKRQHIVELDKQSLEHKAACERLQLQLEISLKEYHDALWADKMKIELSALEDIWKGKLSKEQTRMNQLKQDFALQSQNFALERNNLQKQLDHSDERIIQIEAMNKAEMQALRKQMFEDSEAWELKKKEDIIELENKLEKLKQKELQELQVTCNEETERQLQAEHGRLQDEMDRQVGQMQEESEKLISGLEQAMGYLKNEKTELTLELEKLSNKLEETEDTLYDLQQEMKKVKQEASLTVWKSVTKIIQMRTRFQQGIAQFDQEAARRYAELKREMQVEQDHITLAVLKLGALLQEVEATRVNTHTILINHRTQELIFNRSKIQGLEQDLERATMEKDALEEQKELIEGDIQQMESQVRELEDQIRAHNQVSSMSNGRINVAHARKKRRLDSELEHLLESIEQKRVTMSQMDRRLTEKGHERDDVEMELIEIERKLMEILLEQQKLVMSRLDEGKLVVDKCKVILGVAQVSYPVPAEPTMEHVKLLESQRLAEMEKQDKAKKALYLKT